MQHITFIEIGKLLAGLGIFLYGMKLIEEALKELGGRSFKLFLRKHTQNKIGGILSGTLVTGLLQSSSVVIFMVLAFVGAGIIKMRNALAVVMGCNLGTTLDSWLVATLGFKVNIEFITLPLIPLAVIGIIVFKEKTKPNYISFFLLGFSFLFLGLDYMKEGMELLVQKFDFAPFAHYNRLVFVFIGFLITAIIQSSSATTAITLSALHTGTLPFEMAVSVIIGAEMGTAIKTILGAIDGVVTKKRVAAWNIIFNIFIVIFAIVLMNPILYFIQNIVKLSDPLLALVAFQTIINLAGVIILYPFLNYFGNLLEKSFKEKNNSSTYFISQTSFYIPETALEILEKETEWFILRAVHLNTLAFHISTKEKWVRKEELENFINGKDKKFKTFQEKYDDVKKTEGEILTFYLKIREMRFDAWQFNKINQLISAVRSAMYAAKGIKDVFQDRKDFQNSANDIKFKQYGLLQTQLADFYDRLYNIMDKNDKVNFIGDLKHLLDCIQHDYEKRMNNIYTISTKGKMEEVDISTLLNVNRELFFSCKSMILAVKDYLACKNQIGEFENATELV